MKPLTVLGWLGLSFGLPAISTCANPLAPNTDVGLRVYATISSRRVSRSDSAASFSVEVCAENGSSRAVIVALGPPSGWGTLAIPRPGDGTLHAYRIGNSVDELNAGPATSSWRSSLADTIPGRTQSCQRFPPVEMSNWREGWAVPPGEYTIRSFYNGREGKAAHLIVDH